MSIGFYLSYTIYTQFSIQNIHNDIVYSIHGIHIHNDTYMGIYDVFK